MNRFDRTQLDKCLRLRAAIDRRRGTPPPRLEIAALARKYGATEAEIQQMLAALHPPRTDG